MTEPKEKDFDFEENPPDAFKSSEPPWEDAILTINVTETTDEFKSCEVEIEEWHNRDIIHPSDYEEIDYSLEEYELKMGRWKVQIHVTWVESPATPDCPADWEGELEITELEQLKEV